MKKTAFFYGAGSKSFFSGCAYYFARALDLNGKQGGSFDVVGTIPKRAREIPLTYLRWCTKSGTTRVPLFLLSQDYHNGGIRDLPVPDDTIAYFIFWGQCVPDNVQDYRRAHPDSRIIVYKDVTVPELIESFDYAADPPPRVREQMYEDEKRSCAAADLIAVFHEELREGLVRDYGIPAEKISVIGRGVNFDPEMLSRPVTPRRSEVDHKFHLMVVGRGPRRKGVFRLMDAIDALTADEQDALVLTVAGPKKDELPARPYLRVTGFISADDRDQLATEMAASDVGVLLSEADSLPGSIWEFLALKVPVWVSRLPGLDSALDGYPAIIEDLSGGIPALTKRLRTFLYQPEFLADLVATSRRSTKELTWESPAEFLGEYIRHGRVPDKAAMAASR